MIIAESEEHTFRAAISAHEVPAWKLAVKKHVPAFESVENRHANKCDVPYQMRHQHRLAKLMQVDVPLASCYIPVPCDAVSVIPSLLTHPCLLQLFDPIYASEEVISESFLDALDDVRPSSSTR